MKVSDFVTIFNGALTIQTDPYDEQLMFKYFELYKSGADIEEERHSEGTSLEMFWDCRVLKITTSVHSVVIEVEYEE